LKTFECGACGNTVYFENLQCLRCGHSVGFAPEHLEIVTLTPVDGKFFRELKKGATGLVSYCANEAQGVCNWLVSSDAPTQFCTACTLNRKIPDLSNPANLRAWGDFERAKKRLIYSLIRFGLPLDGTAVGKGPLTFDFVSDALTGHFDGLITIAVGEADAVEREYQRQAMEETYRSLLGHLRHESGHYYWMLLIEGTNYISEFRQLFGDEQNDYNAALQQHHGSGPPPNWALHHVSAYASAHPWEDWAETWAHYLHMVDALDTAAVHRIEPRPSRLMTQAGWAHDVQDVYCQESFGALIERWIPLTLALNDINRSMGHGDFYPFMLPDVVVTKLEFVHRAIRQSAADGR